MPKIAPYGSWSSPVSAELIASKSLGLDQPEIDGGDVYWLELRPHQEGKVFLVRRKADGTIEDLTSADHNVRTRVHEYGGGAYAVKDGRIFFSNFSDQRLYRLEPGSAPVPVTPESGAALRYADGVIDPRRGLLFCVREDHRRVGIDEPEAANTLVALDIREGAPESEGRVIASGYNFYSTPRLDPSGDRICWLAWNHPNMPWDGTELWVGDLSEDGEIMNPRRAAGGPDTSIFQPAWSPDGVLHYVSDQTGWWNLYRLVDGREENLCPMEAEFGEPQWNFGMSTYGFASPHQIVAVYGQNGQHTLALVDTAEHRLENIPTRLHEIFDVRVSGGKAVFFGGAPGSPLALYSLDLNTRRLEKLRASREETLDPGYISIPERIEFPTEHGQVAYAYYYRPTNPEFSAPQGEKPPLVVMSHGGPTSSVSTTYRLKAFYFTSRGIAVVDVDYGGSTGYGREYRRRLNGQWGVVDVEDCTNAALFLANRGDVDPERLAITGGSAGGYTTLCALTFHDVFKAGASYYGIGDLETFVGDTHKFESRYLDTLVGKYPEKKELYRMRSPMNFLNRLSCAMILFQGTEDKIVPPVQSERMYDAVSQKGLPVAYLPFEGEQHGFRKSENIRRSLEAELYFYSQVFGFALADPVESVDIKNLRA